jgi:U3 small nucleolar RNA-associated protein 4
MGVGNDYTEAPSDYNKHLRRDGYTLTDDDRFWTLVSRGPPLGAGFLFHVECWELLRTCVHPHEVPAERFFDLCASFPIISRDRQLEWGHDHGGFRKKIQTRYPWEECRTQLGNAILNYPPYYNEPPLGITDLDDVFDSKAPAGFADNPVSHRFQKQRDCFSILPVEICLEVLISLPSKDVKNLRKASRSFARISLPQMFWVSRFARGFERDYLFDVKLLNSNLALNEKLDAKSIYYQTIPGRILCGGLTNRRRIWKFLRELVAVLSIKREEHVSPLPGSWNSGDLAWRQVHGAIPTRDEWTRRHERPCKPIYERVAYVPTNIERVFVSTVTFNENEWISGFRVVGQDGKTVCFGYIYPESETSLDLTGEDGKPGVLTGFVTAVGPAGIHALRATMLDGRSTPWVGVPEMAPKSLRLCMGERITHIKALFDVTSPLFPSIWPATKS